MSLLPDPVPLDPPPGRADAVLAAADRAAAAARSLDELAERLTMAGTPAWLGADAAAAGERRVRIARLADDAAGALHRAAARLRGHADVLGEVATRTTVLRAAQDAEFAAARSRVAVPFDPLDPLAPEPAVVIGELRAADETRGTEYRLLAARLADDTAHTVRVLAGCTALIGGTPRWNSDVALLRLAALLPAWGTPEVARRGHLLALALREGDIHSDDLEATFAADADLAADPAYAAAFLAGLGQEMGTRLLTTAWSGVSADDPRTDLLARVLSGLDRDSAGPPWLAPVLDDAREAGIAEGVTGGLAAVLARAQVLGLPGPPPALAVAWARSLALEERRTGLPAAVGTRPAGAHPATSDPLALVLAPLVEQGAAPATARLMSDVGVWTVVLSHGWNDGGTLRDALVDLVAEAPAEAARPALRDALVALGTGLEDGDHADWPFVEDVVVGAVPALGAALVRHPDVLVRPLAGAAAGGVDAVSVTALRGLAVAVALDVSIEGGTGGRIGDLIAGALSGPRPEALPVEAAAVAVPAAFVGVREYGARLALAMQQHRLQDEAEAKAYIWDWTFGIWFSALGAAPAVGRVAGALEAVVTRVLGTDGSFEDAVDRGRHFAGTDAMAGAVDGTATGSPERGAAARTAVLAFAGTVGVLGDPVGPVSPDEPLLGEVAKAMVGDALGGAITKRLGVRAPLDAPAGDVLVSGGERLLDAAG